MKTVKQYRGTARKRWADRTEFEAIEYAKERMAQVKRTHLGAVIPEWVYFDAAREVILSFEAIVDLIYKVENSHA